MDHLNQLKSLITQWSIELGFDDIGISDINIQEDERHLNDWLNNNYHGSMFYMKKHGNKRSRPDLLVNGTLRVISLKVHYYSREQYQAQQDIENSNEAYIANYALGRDYHKTIKNKLKSLVSRIKKYSKIEGQNFFVDSAPVLERAFARDAGLGWIGKHTNLINKKHGSWFFLAEIFTDLALPIDIPSVNHCGTCDECIKICPTQAIVAPYQLDARRCISYLTIENKDKIPLNMRKSIGNRIFGCDDCQIFCPWNKFAKQSIENDFLPNKNLMNQSLETLFKWSKIEWDNHTKGSAIRRAGYFGWLRNLAVALGNSEKKESTKSLLISRLNDTSNMVREHIEWAIGEQNQP